MKSSKPYVVFETSNGNVEMTKPCLARWLCLLEGFHIMEKKAEEVGINLEKKDWVKPLAFEKYIQERFESMMLDLEIDAKEGKLDDIKFTQTDSSPLVVAPVG